MCLLHPVVNPPTQQAGGIRVKVAPAQLVAVNPIFSGLAVGKVQGGGDVGREEIAFTGALALPVIGPIVD